MSEAYEVAQGFVELGQAATRQAEALERIVELLTQLVAPPELDPVDECGDCFGMYACNLKPGHDGRHAYIMGGRFLADWPAPGYPYGGSPPVTEKGL